MKFESSKKNVSFKGLEVLICTISKKRCTKLNNFRLKIENEVQITTNTIKAKNNFNADFSIKLNFIIKITT